ncbi:MAG: PKD domain-containing protein, partial [Solirubrobacteraceae bacterium]
GGLGDPDMWESDQTSGYECQDGGFDPSSKPHPEKKEERKEKNAAEEKTEEEAFAKMDKEEQEAQIEKEKLEGPHQQEPNQQPCPTPDGGCDTGLADLIINQIAVEQQDTTTDPLLNAWQDPVGNEVMDECRNEFALVRGGGVTAQALSDSGSLYNQVIGPNNYYLNDTFNLAAEKLGYPGVGCLTGISLLPQFTAPNHVNVNELVSFDGMESDITLNAGVSFTPTGEEHPAYATFTWNFGDGSAPVSGDAPGAPSVNSPGVSPCAAPWEAPCAASAYHSYQYGGVYQVTLTVTDLGGNTGSVTEPITIVGPSPPSPSSTGGSATVTPSNTPAAGAVQGQAVVTASPAVTPTPPPVLGASIASKSLKKALSGGLAVRYTANEQVAGSIQVLLEGTVAKRLGIHGATATGLPKGTPRSIVVGTAVLVTTKAGQGTIHIKFSSRTAAHLARTHKLKLTLRLFARNASRQSPQTTTVLSTVTLNG